MDPNDRARDPIDNYSLMVSPRRVFGGLERGVEVGKRDRADSVRTSLLPSFVTRLVDTRLGRSHSALLSAKTDTRTSLLSLTRPLSIMTQSPSSFVLSLSNRCKATLTLAQTGFSPFIKRTFRIIIDTGEAVVNLISEEMLEATNFSCIDSPRGTSEWGLTYVPLSAQQVIH